MNPSVYTGIVVLTKGGSELLRVAVKILHPDEIGWSGEQLDETARAPKKFVPEQHPIDVMLLDDPRRGETAEAMVAVLHGHLYMVGVSAFAATETR